MLDGLYGSVICFYMAFLMFRNGNFVTDNGLSLDDKDRIGVYVGTAAVIVINVYILINTYRWDWLMGLIVVISTLLIFFWTGVYSAFTSAAFFYNAAPQTFSQATFWAVTCLSSIVSLMPRFCIKFIQKVYFPLDVDVIREQVRLGKFDHLDHSDSPGTMSKGSSTTSSGIANPSKHTHYPSEDQRPIYPPSVAPTATTRNRNGSEATEFTQHRPSLDPPLPRMSTDRPRPSFDRMRASMDRMRPSHEQSNDLTSAAMLTRMESSNSFSPISNSRRDGLR